MYKRSHPVLPGGRVLEHPLDRGAVAEPHGSARGIYEKLPRDVPGDSPLVLKQQPLEAADVAERAAVRQLAAAVDRQRGMEGKLLPVVAKALVGRRAPKRAVAVPPAAHDVEVFQGEPCRVDLRMAGRAAWLYPVL